MDLLIWLTVFTCYFIVEFVINIFFTYKIKHVSSGEYTKAAWAGAVSTFLFIFSTLLAAILGISLIDGVTEFSHAFFDSKLLFIVWTTLGLTVGNFMATISIGHFERKREEKNKEKK